MAETMVQYEMIQGVPFCTAGSYKSYLDHTDTDRVTSSIDMAVDLESVKINRPVTIEDLRVTFPPGTHAEDNIVGITYIISRDAVAGLDVMEIDEPAVHALIDTRDGRDQSASTSSAATVLPNAAPSILKTLKQQAPAEILSSISTAGRVWRWALVPALGLTGLVGLSAYRGRIRRRQGHA